MAARDGSPMEFHTQPFALFFAVFFVGYWAIRPHRWRMCWLLFGSVAFYLQTGPAVDVPLLGGFSVRFPWHILLILGSASVDYCVALRLERTASPRVRKLLVCFSIACNLSLLCFFKYMGFFVENVQAALAAWGLPSRSLRLDLILPLGISFYTFETISYIVDVHAGKVKPVRSLLDYALYIMFFPHLIAGPIVRANDFVPQLQRPKRFRWLRLRLGAWLFLIGLFKKAVLADHLALVSDPVFAAPEQFDGPAAWLGVLAYSCRIYCDFSGYTDMARGLAQMLGFHLPLNFRLPYLAADISEFWQRWHISLSTWLRDYLYIPLGGNRHGKLLTYRNLFLTMLLGGLWHGAKWTFVVWGAYHGLLLILQRVLPWPGFLKTKPGRLVCVAGTFLLVTVGWVFFRADSLEMALLVLRRLVVWDSGLPLDPALRFAALLALLASLGYFVLAPLLPVRRWGERLPAAVQGLALGLLFAAALLLVPDGTRPFIYFQF